MSTAAASAGDQVSFSGQGPDGDDSGSCTVEFDGALLAGAACFWDKSGSIFGTFDVPTDAATGVSASVSVCWLGCYDDAVDDVLPDYWQANTDLDIAAPFVEVPDVTCLPVRDAAARLEQAGFNVSVTGEVGDVVTDQEPRPGARIQQTVPVVLLLQAVLVPEVVGSKYDEARAALEETCLAISAIDGITEGAVTLQDPGAGAKGRGWHVRVRDHELDHVQPADDPAHHAAHNAAHHTADDAADDAADHAADHDRPRRRPSVVPARGDAAGPGRPGPAPAGRRPARARRPAAPRAGLDD